MSLFYKVGRSLGFAAIPALRKSKWAWHALAGNEADATKAETEFGSSMAAELRLKAGVANDPEMVGLVREILAKLAANVRNKERVFRVDLLLEPSPTAMALPGGFIFMSAGMAQLCQSNPDELAFLLGHEMAHVIRGHALERMLTRIGAEGLNSIVSRGLLNPVLRETGLKWLERSHASEAEFEADEFAVRAAGIAGYDPNSAIVLLERVSQLRETEEGAGEYFGSHPPETDRIAKIRSVIAKPDKES